MSLIVFGLGFIVFLIDLPQLPLLLIDLLLTNLPPRDAASPSSTNTPLAYITFH